MFRFQLEIISLMSHATGMKIQWNFRVASIVVIGGEPARMVEDIVDMLIRMVLKSVEPS